MDGSVETFNPIQLADKLTTILILLIFLWFVIQKWKEDIKYYRDREANLWSLLIEFIKGSVDDEKPMAQRWEEKHKPNSTNSKPPPEGE